MAKNPTLADQDMNASSKLRKELCQKTMKIALQGRRSIFKIISMPKSMKLPDVKAAVDKGKEKVEKLPAWTMTKEKSKIEVIEEAQKKGRTVHSATLMDVCHSKNAELVPKFQKYRGQVVLQGDIVKDDSGSCAVFTEQ